MKLVSLVLLSKLLTRSRRPQHSLKLDLQQAHQAHLDPLVLLAHLVKVKLVLQDLQDHLVDKALEFLDPPGQRVREETSDKDSRVHAVHREPKEIPVMTAARDSEDHKESLAHQENLASVLQVSLVHQDFEDHKAQRVHQGQRDHQELVVQRGHKVPEERLEFLVPLVSLDMATIGSHLHLVHRAHQVLLGLRDPLDHLALLDHLEHLEHLDHMVLDLLHHSDSRLMNTSKVTECGAI